MSPSIEGIVLKTVPYQEQHQILKLFTLDRGVASILFFGKKQRHPGVMSHVSMECREGKNGLLICSEHHMIRGYSDLRGQLNHLQAACTLLESVYQSQFADKPAPRLFQLLLYCLNQIPLADDPFAVSSSMRLKILRHDGVLNCTGRCAKSGQPLKEAVIWDGECYDPKSIKEPALHFTEEESDWLLFLTHCQSTELLRQIVCTQSFHEKVSALFQRLISM